MATATLRTPRGQLGAAVGLSLVMSVLLITASAAFAQTSASATGTGTETGFTPGSDFGTGNHPHCLEVTASDYTVNLTGTYSVNPKTYDSPNSGAATLTWATSQTYFIDETGTYTVADHSHGCDLTTLGDPITATVNLQGGNTTHGVSCPDAPGSYSRTNGMDIAVTVTASCTVYNGSGSTATVNATFVGELNPCDGSPGCPVSFITDGAFSW